MIAWRTRHRVRASARWKRLGPDARDETVRARAGRREWAGRQPGRRAQAALVNLDRQDVHGRRADERGREERRRAVVDLQRRTDLLQPPLVRGCDPIPSDMASTWSCVTITIVAPSRSCRCFISVRMSKRNSASRFVSGSSSRNAAARAPWRGRARCAAARRRRACFGLRSSRSCSRSISATASTRCPPRRPRSLAAPQRERDVVARSGVGTARRTGTPWRCPARPGGRSLTRVSPMWMSPLV